MTIKKGHAGTLESNDIMISVEEKPSGFGVQIELTSIVEAQFGNAIRCTLAEEAVKAGFPDIFIKAVDKGRWTVRSAPVWKPPSIAPLHRLLHLHNRRHVNYGPS